MPSVSILCVRLNGLALGLWCQSTSGSDEGLSDLERMVYAALIALGVGVLLFIIRDVTAVVHTSNRARVQYRNLLYLFLKEVDAGAQRCTQYVRQVTMGEASASKLTTLTTHDQMSQLGELSQSPSLLEGLHDIYRLFDLVQHQITKGGSYDNHIEFARILAFVRDDFDDFSAGINELVKRAQQDLDVTQKQVAGKVIETLLKSRDECSDWLKAYPVVTDVLSRPSLPPAPGRIEVEEIRGLLKTKPVTAKFLRALYKRLRSSAIGSTDRIAKQQLTHVSWIALARLGNELVGSNEVYEEPVDNNMIQGMFLKWYRYIAKNDQMPYDPELPPPPSDPPSCFRNAR